LGIAFAIGARRRLRAGTPVGRRGA
jgi:hypothetical protein